MRIVLSGMASLLLIGCLVSIPMTAAADDALYYRGYFEARAAEIPFQGFVYQVDPNTIQPAFYYQYRTQQIPLGPRNGVQPGGAQATASKAPFQPQGSTVLITPVPLPGQYWYTEPGAYAFRTHDLGWPYGNQR